MVLNLSHLDDRVHGKASQRREQKLSDDKNRANKNRFISDRLVGLLELPHCLDTSRFNRFLKMRISTKSESCNFELELCFKANSCITVEVIIEDRY